MMSGEAQAQASVPPIHDNHSHATKPYNSSGEQAQQYAAELEPATASAFTELSHTTTLVLREYFSAIYQEGHSYTQIKGLRDAMKQYFEDTFGCCGTMWQFVPDEGKDEASSKEDEERDGERGQWKGNPVFDKDFVRLMHQLKEADETRHVKRKPAFGYDEMAVFMEHLQKSETIETEGIGRCLFIQAFAATAFTLWLT